MIEKLSLEIRIREICLGEPRYLTTPKTQRKPGLHSMIKSKVPS